MRIELKASKNRLSVVIRVTSCSEGGICPHMLTGIIAPFGREQDASKMRPRSNLRSPQSAKLATARTQKVAMPLHEDANDWLPRSCKRFERRPRGISYQSDLRSDEPQYPEILMSAIIRSALAAIVFLTGASVLVMAAPHSGCNDIHSEEVSPAWPSADFWDSLNVV